MKQYFYIVDLIRNIYCSSCSNEDSDNNDNVETSICFSPLYDSLKQFYTIHTDAFICINDNVETSICFSPQGKDELFLLHLGFTNNICLNSTNSMSTICDSVYEINNRFLEYKKQFYDFLKQSYTKHTMHSYV